MEKMKAAEVKWKEKIDRFNSERLERNRMKSIESQERSIMI